MKKSHLFTAWSALVDEDTRLCGLALACVAANVRESAVNGAGSYFHGDRLLSFSSIFQPCSRIIEGKERDDPKTVPLKIFAKDIGNCAYVRSSSSPDVNRRYRYQMSILQVWTISLSFCSPTSRPRRWQSATWTRPATSSAWLCCSLAYR